MEIVGSQTWDNFRVHTRYNFKTIYWTIIIVSTLAGSLNIGNIGVVQKLNLVR